MHVRLTSTKYPATINDLMLQGSWWSPRVMGVGDRDARRLKMRGPARTELAVAWGRRGATRAMVCPFIGALRHRDELQSVIPMWRITGQSGRRARL